MIGSTSTRASIITPASTPASLGMPAQFPSFRPIQIRMVQDIADASAAGVRFIASTPSTGSGKSLGACTAASLLGSRTLYLTSTKNLSKQVLDDFGSIGMEEVRGRANYRCIHGNNASVTCEEGGVLGCGAGRFGMCPYTSAVERVKQSEWGTTNYSYHMHANKYADGLGQYDTLICDEVHDVIDTICAFMSITLSLKETRGMLNVPAHMELDPDMDTPDTWGAWAEEMVPELRGRVEQLQDQAQRTRDVNDARTYKKFKDLLGKLQNIAQLQQDPDLWVVDWVTEWASKQHTGVRFDPIWPMQFAEDVLFRGVQTILLISATVTEKTLRLLGLQDGEFKLFSYPPVFDPARCPVYYVPTVRVDHRMDESAKRAWVSRMDQFMEPRLALGRNGLIHTGSYDRVKWVKQYSRFADRMITHSSFDTEAKVQQFKRSTGGRVLVSPSLTTGVDFPGNLARWQILGKIPQPDTRSKVMKARIKLDPQYGDHIAAQTFQQACGRIMRGSEDWGETVCLDDHFKWWYNKVSSAGLLSTNFAVRWAEGLPEPLHLC